MKRLISIILLSVTLAHAEVSVDLSTGSVSEALRLVSDAHNVKLIAPADLTSSVILRLPDHADLTQVVQTLQRISVQKWSYVLQGNTLLVYPTQDTPIFYKFVHVKPPQTLPLGCTLVTPDIVQIVGDEQTRLALADQFRSVDVKPRVVRVSTRMYEVSSNDSKNLGVTWPASVSGTLDPATGSLDLGKISLDLAASVSAGNARIVSQPTVAVQSGDKAIVAVGDQYPLPKYSLNQDTGTMILSGYDYKDIGVKLVVTPHVVDDDIVLDVSADVSSVSGSTVVQGTSLPTVSTRSTSTVLRMSSGSTTVIGGLITSTDVASSSRVLGVSKLPVLGSLFRSKSRRGGQTELVITITASVE